MYKIDPAGAGAVQVRIIGAFTDEDYAGLLPALASLAERAGRLNLLLDMREFTGWQWQAAWDKSAFGKKYWDRINRLGLIGGPACRNLARAAGERIPSAEIRHFDPSQGEAASRWLAAAHKGPQPRI